MAISSLFSLVFIELSIILDPIFTIRPPIRDSSTLLDKTIFLTPVAFDIADLTSSCCDLSSAKDDVTSAFTSPLILEISDKKHL